MADPVEAIDSGRSLFWRGVLTGLGLTAVMLALVVGVVTRRGVEVSVETAGISRQVAVEIRQAVRQELPGVLAGIKADLPRRVSQEAGRRLAAYKLDIGGFEVPVPQAAVRQVEESLEQALRSGLDAAVSQKELDGLATRLGDQGARLADRRLKELLRGQVVTVEVIPGLRLPVRLVPR